MIDLSGVSLSVGQHHILRDISFRIEAGETFCLIGESGGGKTSLAHLLLGLLDGEYVEAPIQRRKHNGIFRWAGRAYVARTDVLRARPTEMRALLGRRIGLIAQGLFDALNPHQTVRQHIEEMISIHHAAGCDAISVSRDHNIPEALLNRFPADLSGGEIQRLLLALALIGNPDHLILDEPTASLDPANKRFVIEVLQREQCQRCQLLVTHDLDLARQLADRVGVLYQGEIVETGTIDDVLSRPKHEYTRQLVLNDRGQSLSVSGALAMTEMRKEASKMHFFHHAPEEEGLRISGLTHRYGNKTVIEDLSLYLPAGSSTVIEGPSGGGKSTLARLLTGFEQIQHGEIKWCGRNADNETGVGAVRAALVSQHPHRALARHFSVADALHEAIQLSDMKALPSGSANDSEHDRIICVLKQAWLPTDQDFLEKRTATLSGGEAQRLVIARALITSSKCLVADEPTSALDMIARSQILMLLRQLASMNKLIVVVFSHDPTVASFLGAKRLELRDGKLR